MVLLAACVGPTPTVDGPETLVIAVSAPPDFDAPRTPLDHQAAALVRRPSVAARFDCALQLDPPDADRSRWMGDPEPVDLDRPTGPWRLVSRDEERLRFEPAPGAAPRLGAIELLVIPEPAERMRALKNEEVDLVEGLRAADVDSLAADSPEVVVRRRGWRTVYAVAWNQRRGTGPEPDPLFASAALRRALTGAIDTDRMLRDHLTSAVYGEVYGRPAIGPVSPSLCGLEAGDMARAPHDPAASRATLASLGWADHDGDEVLDREGLPFRFGLIADASDPFAPILAEEARADLVGLGLDVQVHTLAAEEHARQLEEGSFDAALIAIELPPWPEARLPAFAFVGRDDRVAEGIAQQAIDSGSPRAWQAWQRRLDEEHALSFLVWRDELVGIDARFENTRIDLLSAWGDTERWSVAADRVRRPPP